MNDTQREIAEQVRAMIPRLVDKRIGTIRENLIAEVLRRIDFESLSDDVLEATSKRISVFGGSSLIPRINADTVDFLPSGTAPIARDLQTRGRILVFASDYALADGTNQQTGLANALSRASGGELIVDGAFRADTGALVIPDGTVLRFMGTNAKIDYRGTGACFEIRNSKNIALYDPNIDLTNAGANAIGLWVRGGWFLAIHKPKITQAAATHTAILIETSQTGGDNFGSYMIEIHNPRMHRAASTSGNYGIRTVQTAGDTVAVTHLNVYGGWSKGNTYGIYLRNVSGFQIHGFAADTGTDGINVASCDNGLLMPGELGGSGGAALSGYSVNFGTGCSGLTLLAPNNAVTGTSGYQNNATYTPQYFNQGKVRVYGSNSDQTYYAELISNFSYGNSFSLAVNGGGTVRNLINFDDANGARYISVQGVSQTTTASKNLRGFEIIADAATTATVSFGTAEADNTYFVVAAVAAVTGAASAGSKTVWITGKGTGGFTINLSAAPGAGTSVQVNWILIR